MTFLKKVGQIILEGVKIVVGFSPIANAAVPSLSGPLQVISKDLAEIAAIVVDVEAVGQALSQPGAVKFANAGPAVAQVVLQSSLLVGKKIADPVLFQKGCAELGGAMADILNSLHESGVQTIDKTA